MEILTTHQRLQAARREIAWNTLMRRIGEDIMKPDVIVVGAPEGWDWMNPTFQLPFNLAMKYHVFDK